MCKNLDYKPQSINPSCTFIVYFQNLSSHISRSHPSVHKMLVTEGALPNDHQSTPPTRGESILTTTVTPSLQKSDTSQLRKLLTSKAAAALQSSSADATSEGSVRQDQRLSGAVKHDQGVPGGRFSCPYCQFAHNAEATWVQHLHQHIGSGSEKFQVYKCKTCYWTSTSQKKIIIHNMVIHQQAEGVVLSEYIEIGKKSVAPQNQPTKYSCTECDFSCNNAAKFKGQNTVIFVFFLVLSFFSICLYFVVCLSYFFFVFFILI